LRLIEDVRQDVRYAVRTLLKSPGFTLTSVVTFALGIGATTAVFSVVDAVVLKPLPFARSDRLVQVYGTPAIRGEAVERLDELRSQAGSFEMLVGYQVSARHVGTPGGPERVMVVEAERNFFALLDVSALAGRTFHTADPVDVAVVSESFWRQRLGGDASVVGSSLFLDGAPVTVIGVMPETFQFPYGAGSVLKGVAPQIRTDLWIPLDPPPESDLRARIAYVTGRLKPNVTLQAAGNELSVVSARLAAANPDPAGPAGVRLEPLSEAVVPQPIRQSLFLLFGAAASVLTLICANVSGLSLVRTVLRSREIAVRVALGAATIRLVRQFLIETLLLSMTGGLVGLVMGWWSVEWLMRRAVQLPRAHEVSLDWRVFGLLAALCIVAAAVPALASVLVAMRRSPHDSLRAGDRHGTLAGPLGRLRDGLAVAEVALALVLAISATLLIRELVRLRDISRGMDTTDVVTLHVGQPPPNLGAARRGAPLETESRAYYEIAQRVSQLQGVRAAGFVQVLPLQNWGWSANSIGLTVQGRTGAQPPPFQFELRYVTPGYFQALGIPIRRGRAFTVDDRRDTQPVIMVNETFARGFFGPDDPIGQATSRGTIVGLVGDVRNVSLDQPTLPEIYYPIAQNWSQVTDLGMSLVVRTDGPSSRVVDRLRAIVRDVDPNYAVFSIKTMDAVVAESMAGFIVFLSLTVSFAVLAIVLALTGTYGLVSYVATSRMREFAVRTALGADRTRVSRLVLFHGAAVTAMGLAIGIALVTAVAPLLKGLPVAVHAPDLEIVAPVAVLIGVTSLAACLLPARRAATADPMVLLRSE